MNEFDLIGHFFAPLSGADAAGVECGIGDDAALLRPTPGQRLVVTSDTLVEGRHFLRGAPAADVGYKALAVNLSDLAAMGATPRWFTLALTLPAVDAGWLAQFAAGLQDAMRDGGIALVGGDTTGGPLAMTLTAFGEVPPGQALRRDGARVGDRIAVTGTLGDASAALALARGGHPQTALEDRRRLVARMHRPTPRCAAGQALRGIATAAVDVSDGFAADLGHVLAASDVAGVVDVARLPQSAALVRSVGAQAADLHALSGGDDYELCVCVPAARIADAKAACAAAGTSLQVVGEVVAGRGLRLIGRDGKPQRLARAGHDHFG